MVRRECVNGLMIACLFRFRAGDVVCHSALIPAMSAPLLPPAPLQTLAMAEKSHAGKFQRTLAALEKGE